MNGVEQMVTHSMFFEDLQKIIRSRQLEVPVF